MINLLRDDTQSKRIEREGRSSVEMNELSWAFEAIKPFCQMWPINIWTELMNRNVVHLKMSTTSNWIRVRVNSSEEFFLFLRFVEVDRVRVGSRHFHLLALLASSSPWLSPGHPKMSGDHVKQLVFRERYGPSIIAVTAISGNLFGKFKAAKQ